MNLQTQAPSFTSLANLFLNEQKKRITKWKTALIVLCTIMTIVLNAADSEHGAGSSILTSGALSLYISYLTWSGLTSSVTDVATDPD